MKMQECFEVQPEGPRDPILPPQPRPMQGPPGLLFPGKQATCFSPISALAGCRGYLALWPMGHLIQAQATPPGLGTPVHSANPRPSGECPLQLARTSPGGLGASLGTREGTSAWAPPGITE